MSSVSLSLRAPTSFFGEQISATHFGTSFENRGQTVNAGSPVTQVIEKLPISYLRFPGGTQTESYFNPANPENPRPTNIFSGGTAPFEPISKFIAYVTQKDIKPIFVIPTFRYFDKDASGNSFLTANARQEIHAFVKDILTGKYGSVDVAAFEIGNEWFNSRYVYDGTSNPEGWTAAEFGKLQGEIAAIVNAAIKSAGVAKQPDIWVQSSQHGDPDLDNNGISDNREILAGISTATLREIDGVVDHFYQPTRALTPLEVIAQGWSPSERISRMIEDGWNVAGQNGLDIVATEWNVRAARNGNLSGDDANITGLERLPIFLGLFADMVQAGVDAALIFTAQALGPEPSATLSRKGETTLTPTGMLFDMMGRALPGTKLVDPNGDGKLTANEYFVRSSIGQNVGVTYQFKGESSTVFYFASGVGEPINLNLSGLNPFLGGEFVCDIKLLTVVEGGNPLSATVNARILQLSYEQLDGANKGDGAIHLSLPAYSLIQITFTQKNQSISPQPVIGTVLQAIALDGSDNLHTAGTANDTVMGGSGNDTLSGASGNDVIHGETGNDQISGDLGNDSLFGGEGLDVLRGGAGNDSLDGGAGDDSIDGGLNNDTLRGGSGNDTLNGDHGSDVLDGGAGERDLVTYATATSAVTIALDGSRASSGFALGDIFLSIEDVEGGAFNDWLHGDAGANIIHGLAGNDTVFGSGGSDTILGGQGSDSIDGGAGNDSLYGDGGNDLLDGGLGDDRIDGGDGNDRLTDTSGRNQFFGGAGNDTIIADAENDILNGDAGNDSLSAGSGNDTLLGGDGNDTMMGDDGADRVLGGAGRDRLLGGSGNDTLEGGSDADVLFGGVGDDRVIGDDGNDTIYGGDGNDRIGGMLGNDIIWGGGGDDEIGAGEGNDRLMGDSGNDSLSGFQGNDWLDGGAGKDRLDGGIGNDTLIGGADADTFVFVNLGRVQRDEIRDFQQGIDRIELSSDTILEFSDLLLRGVTGGVEVKAGDQTIFLSGQTMAMMDASDFLFT